MGAGDEPLGRGEKTHHLVPRFNSECSYASTLSLRIHSVFRNHAHILLDTVDCIHKSYCITVYQADYIEIFTSFLHVVFRQFI